ncbi:MAG TPA: hypothetical protein PLA65_09475 [Spirochaetota bacterium]|nr:hypothetical protein [Spirochaetota bacterium]HOD14367.1 hypothetical protein [Spirochaetota bacterium]HPN12280.1 hypothetical protein [Spirochaetota bacterium]
MNKEIPPQKQEVVRTLLNNKRLDPREKYRTIIEVVQTCPDKKAVLYHGEDTVPPAPDRKKRGDAEVAGKPAPSLSAPTETSYFVDELLGKYASTRLFRKRYLVHRNNRFGIGFRKRLVPTRGLMRVFEYLAETQGLITARLTTIMMEILKDPEADNPIVFNYLRIIRKWLLEVPLIHLRYDAVKWMERAQFDRELRGWALSFLSFLKLDGDTREKILLEVETRLRAMDDLRKETPIDNESDSYRREREKRNLEKEKQVYECMMLFRSYLPVDPKQDGLLSQRLKNEFGLGSLLDLVMALEEALVFQRPVTPEEASSHFGIQPPFVNQVAWDYSEDFLKKVGKDAESIQGKKKESLRKKLEPYETMALMLKIEDGGQSLLMKGAEDQWRFIDRKHYDTRTTYNENFIAFIDALVQYFKNMYIPLLDGTTVVFRDTTRQEIEGALFSFMYFQGHLGVFNKILDEMHFFRTKNPTLALTRDEAKKMLRGQSGSQSGIEKFIRSIGDCFFLIARELQRVLDRHRLWSAGRTGLPADELIRESLKEGDMPGTAERGRPLPFYDCVVKEVENGTALTRELSGKRLIEDSLRDGIFVRMCAFAYQTAYECMSERLARELEERNKLMKLIEETPE